MGIGVLRRPRSLPSHTVRAGDIRIYYYGCNPGHWIKNGTGPYYQRSSCKVNSITSNPNEVAGTYRIVVHYLGGSSIAGDNFVVEPTRLDEIKIRRLMGTIQDVATMEQFSIKKDGNIVGINLPNVTHIVLEKL